MILEPIVTPPPEAGEAPGASAGSAEAPSANMPSGAAASAEPARRAEPPVPPLELPIVRPGPSRGTLIRTIPPTTLLGPLAPLEATPGGVGRRTTPVGARRMEIQRAESLLFSRLAGLPGAGVPEQPSAGLAEGGGVTVPVPWGGFVPEDRKDRVWREERCAGKDADEADKPGEREARSSQCD